MTTEREVEGEVKRGILIHEDTKGSYILWNEKKVYLPVGSNRDIPKRNRYVKWLVTMLVCQDEEKKVPPPELKKLQARYKIKFLTRDKKDKISIMNREFFLDPKHKDYKQLTRFILDKIKECKIKSKEEEPKVKAPLKKPWPLKPKKPPTEGKQKATKAPKGPKGRKGAYPNVSPNVQLAQQLLEQKLRLENELRDKKDEIRREKLLKDYQERDEDKKDLTFSKDSKM